MTTPPVCKQSSGDRRILGRGNDAACRQAHIFAPGSLLLSLDVPENLLYVVTAPGGVLVAHGPEFIDDLPWCTTPLGAESLP